MSIKQLPLIRFFYPRNNRFYLPLPLNWLCKIPLPKWLKRWYYNFSVKRWGAPNAHHWKEFVVCKKGSACAFSVATCHNNAGERCLWCGSFVEKPAENQVKVA